VSRDQIVIVTQTDDPHADDVIIALERKGEEAVRINTDEIPENVRISMTWEDELPFAAVIDVLTSGRTMTADAVRSVWWRRPGFFGLPAELSPQEYEFATGEIEHALRSLWASLDCYWISEPQRILHASWKGGQLLRARRLGFEIPRTLVTTDPDEAREFFYRCGKRMIFKVMSDPFLGAVSLSRKDPDFRAEPYRVTTTVVTEDDLDLLDSVRITPCLFQEYVPKKVELRITVIGGEIFTAELHSQERAEASVDWRNAELDIPYRAGVLPAPVATRCLDFVRGYGLNFSAIDVIVTPDDRYVFVESNPNGQFIFIEHQVPELAMTDALADCLIRGASIADAGLTAR
jgi:glutathione synthase/RimK-type ligase-like ATP-grasp enzyme